MPLITNATSAWSTGVTLTENEFWQCRDGLVALSTATSPGVSDGIILTEGFGIDLAAGKTVKYRTVNSTVAVISREEV